MKIDSISNLTYSPNIAHREPIGGAKNTAPEQKPQEAASAVSHHNGLTSAERAFFAKLFPDSSSQISSHLPVNIDKTYSPNGIHSSVELGQIINRKV